MEFRVINITAAKKLLLPVGLRTERKLNTEARNLRCMLRVGQWKVTGCIPFRKSAGGRGQERVGAVFKAPFTAFHKDHPLQERKRN